MLSFTKKQSGFTLIELLVVVAIIGLLSSVVMASLNSARAKARDAKRKVELKQIQAALEIYYNDNNAYPVVGTWWGLSVNGGSKTTSGANAYIPGLTPTYIPTLPADPSGVTTGWSGYLYRSNGSQYKLLSHATGPESFPGAGQPFYDPVRPTWAWMLCNGEPACSTW
ncbi:MAG: General secretion pathway protein G [Candidatus Nomurabacteria bacterium GW2011_GWA1_46_11]|uniref:General secretion pathway protein G n=2 Tax=Candidatus Nomuraibacteriota TaxID=1752729 RepID=A0A0G1T116_9BACT|nr:MAG: General secretion pathway protein G [Candidatus Nomurabacteria bacterium GW2011_GWA1_46_11]KKU75459.1 MAG: General secretion pathway protein G [Candidatus Nomurabacteria bacterium GW2011_GWB1_47_6]